LSGQLYNIRNKWEHYSIKFVMEDREEALKLPPVGSSPTPTTKNTNTRCVNALSIQVLDVEIAVFFVVGW